MSEQKGNATSCSGALGVSMTVAAEIVDRALAHGRSLGLGPLTVVVLDCAGRAVVLKREDGSSLLRPDIANAKAWGALAMGMGSRGLAERASTHPAFITAVSTLAGGNLIPVPGGVLLRGGDGALLGAVGVSGALPDQDEQCALAAIAAVGLAAQVGSGH